ncbi:MAG: DNA photolyase family protein [Chitinophagaceae bacterium]|nr:DNA photolyase family protein [Chitinophagaceae bacterium]
MAQSVNIIWFRRDLRLQDNAALYYALKAGKPVVPVFIFDRDILDLLEDKRDRRVEFIRAAIVEMNDGLLKQGSSMEVIYGFPSEVFSALFKKYEVDTVFTNHDYESYAKERDAEIKKILALNKVQFSTFKDHVILEKDEVLKDDGTPYTVFTPYSRKWKATLKDFNLKSYPCEHKSAFYKQEALPIPTLQQMGFQPVDQPFPSQMLHQDIVRKYSENRNFPGNEKSTSRLGVHLRFGTISIRQLASIAQGLNETYLNELIWRDFYQMILWHFPRVGRGHAFRTEYEHIEWRNNENEFKHWCEGSTGYPIVDAGMRELNATGFMHNRVRMIVASFLTKHLLIDWRWGEAYFAQKLLDFDLASNNGGWQWAAGSGVDAAPYFRIFNPYLQTEKFDKQLTYIKKWVPEFQEFTYPKPIVEHEIARKRALEVYAKTLKK